MLYIAASEEVDQEEQYSMLILKSVKIRRAKNFLCCTVIWILSLSCQDSKTGAARKFFGPSYFVTALVFSFLFKIQWLWFCFECFGLNFFLQTADSGGDVDGGANEGAARVLPWKWPESLQ